MAYNFFVIKATNQSYIFEKPFKKMNVETCVTIVKKKIRFLPFLAFFQPSLAPKLLKLSV